LLGARAGTVFWVERLEALGLAARQALREAGVANVSVLLGDGTLGWSAYAPYDAILVAAGGPEVPPPLVDQLAPNGRLLIPLGEQGADPHARRAGGRRWPRGARLSPRCGAICLLAGGTRLQCFTRSSSVC